jgi:2-polyprenyl-6-methoxyphenol hydroxylase-like FAD-dependent oxidoreductase
MEERRTDRALVLGGGMAGLLAARVLAERYGEVQVLDRDDLTDAGLAARRGVPQAQHIHVLLPRGRQILERLFPGLTAELVADGAVEGDLLGDARVVLNGHRLAHCHGDLLTLSSSRPFLEAHVRDRVGRLPNVRLAEPCDVLGLEASPDGRQVTGVRIIRRSDASAAETLPADLVIDALGRGSRLPMWLGSLGYPPPAEERLDVDLGYVTRRFRLPPDALAGDWGALHGPVPGRPRGGATGRLEDGSWMVTLFGLAGDHPPRDDAGFERFAASLAAPDIHAVVRAGEPIGRPAVYRFPASLRRRYRRPDGLPRGVVPLGDGLCSFNPIYGQGITTAGLAALTLRRHLGTGSPLRPERLLDDLDRVLDPAWEMALGADLAIPEVHGHRSVRTRLGAAYLARLHAAAVHDATLATAFARVVGLVDPPHRLMRPGVAARVLLHRHRRGRARRRDPRMLVASLLSPTLVTVAGASAAWLARRRLRTPQPRSRGSGRRVRSRATPSGRRAWR